MARAMLLLFLSAHCSQALRTTSTPRNGPIEHKPSLVSTLANRKTDETVVIEMMNTGNFQYTVEMEIGGVYTKALVDTGSFGLITTSKRCPADRCPIRSFDHEKATNYRQLDETRTTYFSAGSLKMQAALAPVLFGPGVGPAEIQFWEMTDMGKRMKSLWEATGFQAIAGFAWTEKVPLRGHPGKYEVENTFLQNYEVSSFTLCLGNETRTVYHQDGRKEVFAATPSRLYVGPPGGYSFPHPWRSTLEVQGDGHWSVKLSNIRVWPRDQKDLAKRSPEGPFPVDVCRSEECLAIIDSGTAIMTAPRMQFLDLMGATAAVLPDCTNFHQLPDILFTLGQGEDALDVIMTPDHWVDYLKFRRVQDGKMVEICDPLIIPDSTHSSETPTWVLGAPLMRMFLWEYDRQKKLIRVADHPGECPGERSEPTLQAATTDLQQKKYDHILSLARRPPNSTIDFAAEVVDAQDEADLKRLSLPSERIDARTLLGEANDRGSQ